MAAVRHDLHNHIEHRSPALFSHLDDFVSEVQDRVNKAEGSTLSAKWDTVVNTWPFGLDGMTCPPVLCDVVEAVVGAVWLDSGTDMGAAWKVASRLLAPLHIPETKDTKLPAHPVRQVHVSLL